MMTSSNGNIFRVTGPLCGEFTGPGEFPTQRPVTRSFDVFFDLRLNKRLSKQTRGWWFETQSCSLWRHCNDWASHSWQHLGSFALILFRYRKGSVWVRWPCAVTSPCYLLHWDSILLLVAKDGKIFVAGCVVSRVYTGMTNCSRIIKSSRDGYTVFKCYDQPGNTTAAHSWPYPYSLRYLHQMDSNTNLYPWDIFHEHVHVNSTW